MIPHLQLTTAMFPTRKKYITAVYDHYEEHPLPKQIIHTSHMPQENTTSPIPAVASMESPEEELLDLLTCHRSAPWCQPIASVETI